jgi:hypothetical protein
VEDDIMVIQWVDTVGLVEDLVVEEEEWEDEGDGRIILLG